MGASLRYQNAFIGPGISPQDDEFVAEALWHEHESQMKVIVGRFNSTARDSGSTPTTLLRAGLLIESTGAAPFHFTEWDGTGMTPRIAAVLLRTIDVSKIVAGQALYVPVLYWGFARSNVLIHGLDAANKNPGGWIGGASAAKVRTALANRIFLDDLLRQ